MATSAGPDKDLSELTRVRSSEQFPQDKELLPKSHPHCSSNRLDWLFSLPWPLYFFSSFIFSSQ